MNKNEQAAEQAFYLVKPHIEAAKIKGENITSEMMKEVRKRYATILGDELRKAELQKNKLNGQPVVKNSDKNDEKNNVVEPEKQKSYVPTLKPEPMLPMKNAGFADALILTIIVLVYAAIIINLILKLK